MKKFAIILAGCGQHDGSETHEVILTLLSMKQEGIEWEAFAPDILQKQVVNHISKSIDETETRSVLKESARLVRGKIKPLKQANVLDFDAILFPGGVGAVSNLCNWVEKGKDFSFDPDVKEIMDASVRAKKPMGFICIAPMMIPRIYQSARLTIGNDKDLAKQIDDMNCTHVECQADDVVVDKVNRIVSTPANMVANGIDEVYIGIRKLVRELAQLC